MKKEELFKKWLDETENKKINVVWLEVALLATNDQGFISKEIYADKMFQSDYPDVVQEIQAWIAKIVVAKRFSLIRHFRVKKRILRVIHEIEQNNHDIVKIFYRHRYVFKKHKKKSKINNNKQQVTKESCHDKSI